MDENNDKVYIGHRHEWGGDVPFSIDTPARRQHVYVIGQTGAGKSTLLRNLILQDIEDGRGVALIDPHGDLAADILEHIPPRRTGDVVYFDPSSPDPLAINLFRALIETWTRALNIDEVEALLIEHGVPAGKIYRAPDMLADPHFAAREAIVRLAHPRWGEVAMQNVFPKLSRTPGAVRSIAPQSVGEHNAEIWGGLLGLSVAEMSALALRGVI